LSERQMWSLASWHWSQCHEGGSSPIVHPTEKPQTNRTHRNIADRL